MKLLIENWRGYILKEVRSSHLVLMKPEDFLKLTRVDGDAADERADYILNKLGGFDKNKAGTLSLVIKRCGNSLKVKDHGGRARMLAAMKSGVTEYPVAISFISCDESRIIKSSGLYFDSDVIEAQYSSDIVGVTRIKGYTPGNILGLGDTTDITIKDLRKMIRIEFYSRATDSYRMADYVVDLNKEYSFFIGDEERSLMIGKSVISNPDGTKRFGGMREPVLATDPADIETYPDPNQQIKVQVVNKS